MMAYGQFVICEDHKLHLGYFPASFVFSLDGGMALLFSAVLCASPC